MRNGGGGWKVNFGKLPRMKPRMKPRETCNFFFIIWNWKQNRGLGAKRRRRRRGGGGGGKLERRNKMWNKISDEFESG